MTCSYVLQQWSKHLLINSSQLEKTSLKGIHNEDHLKFGKCQSEPLPSLLLVGNSLSSLIMMLKAACYYFHPNSMVIPYCRKLIQELPISNGNSPSYCDTRPSNHISRVPFS